MTRADGPTEPDLPWLKGPWIVAFGIVGATLGLLAGFGSMLGTVLFVGYMAAAVVLVAITVRKRQTGAD
ncbi:MAG: hypothetical protein JWN67_2784 [Actinomycetia bacterium]|nr:hypothetical protein [Actinomycetes bacterium]